MELGHGGGCGFFQVDVGAGGQCGKAQRCVRLDGRGNDDDVGGGAGSEQVIEGVEHCDVVA